MKERTNWLDMPPVWLLVFLVADWAAARYLPALTITFAGQSLLAIALAAAGLGLMALAVREMQKARTTVIPRRRPDALVTTGIFSRSRNPIYLGDALVLTAASIWWGTLAGLVLVPLFCWLITVRFIRGEEAALRESFGEEFTAWAGRTRRWL